jgi:tetratricopeptide (TPR) repeat protein
MTLARRVLGSWWVFGLGLVLAGRLRLLHVTTLSRTPFFSTLAGDSASYDDWGQRIARGDWGTTPYFVDPLYPTLLGLLYRFAGRDLMLVRLAQVALALVTCAMVGLLAQRLAGAVARNVAVLAWAHLRPDLFNTGEVDKTALGLALMSTALVLVSKPGAPRIASGVLFGLATLTRGNLALAALVPAVFFVLEHRPRDAARFIVALGLVIAPVTVRNRLVSGEWVLTTTGLGPNLYLGNNPGSGSGGYDALPFVRPEAKYEQQDFQVAAERRAGRTLSSREASALWRQEALRFIAANPGLTARRLALKLWLLFNDFEQGDVIDPSALARFAPVLALPLPGVGLVTPFAALGLVVCLRRREARVLLGFTATLALSIAVFFVLARFRAFLLPPLVAFAAAGVTWLARALMQRAWKVALPALALLSVVALVSNWPPPAKKLAPALGPLNLATILARTGDVAQARALVEESHRAAPHAAAPACALAEHELLDGEVARARTHVTECLKADPDFRGAWALLARIERADHHAEAACAAWRHQLDRTPGDEEVHAALSSSCTP